MGFGALVRNSEGQMIGSMRVTKRFLHSPFTTEVAALKEAIKCCKDIGLTQIMLEGDALQVVDILKSETID